MITYDYLISACEKCRMTERALQLLDALQQEGLQPDVITGSALISACEKGTMAAVLAAL